MISDVQHDGTTITKTILVSLDNPAETIAGKAFPAECPVDMPPMPNMDQGDTAQKMKSNVGTAIDEGKFELIQVLLQTPKNYIPAAIC